MALFPRKINGAYATIGRLDGESLFYLRSDNLLHWDEGVPILAPVYPWELVQMGNCGSPIEIDEGWLLLTPRRGRHAQILHRCGASRQGRPEQGDQPDPAPRLSLRQMTTARAMSPTWSTPAEPLPTGGRFSFPYGVADSSVTFCWVDIDSLLAEMV